MSRKNGLKLLALCLAVLTGVCAFSQSALGAESLSGTYNAGTDKTIKVNTAGQYQVNLYGAKGGDHASSGHVGGSGAYVTFYVDLKVGDTVRIVTNTGGGTGTLSNGGGASAMYLNGTLIGVAGGGGGATLSSDGGNAGATDSGGNGKTLIGSSSTSTNSSGGGAGYEGGISGISHIHDGNTSSGGLCYQTPVYHYHVDGNGNKIQQNTSIYQTNSPGGCFSNGSHTHNLNGNCPTTTTGCNGGWRYEAIGTASYQWCTRTGQRYTVGDPYHWACDSVTVYNCGNPINTWSLGCGKVGVESSSHLHDGDGEHGGACYTPVYHTHDDSCGTMVNCNKPYTYTRGEPPNTWEQTDYHGTCKTCGTDNVLPHNPGKKLCWKCKTCTDDKKIISYKLTCTKATPTIDRWKLTCKETGAISTGGSNYINTSKTTLSDQFVNTGTSSYATIRRDKFIVADVNKPTSANYDVVIDPKDLQVKLTENNTLPKGLAIPSLYGFEFNGWFTSKTGGNKLSPLQAINENNQPTIYAHWTAKKVNIALNDANVHSDKLSSYHLIKNYGDKYSLPTPTNKYYNFSGWYTASSGGKKVNNTDLIHYTKPAKSSDRDYINEAYNLYARWTPQSIKVTFNANGGTLSGSTNKNVNNGSTLGNLPNATKAGYTFIGWSTSKNGGVFYDSTSELYVNKSNPNITLYAQFELTSPSEVTWNYTGKTETYTIPYDGFYKLESWAGQGGDYGSYSGGAGGYTSGVRYFEAGDKLYINIGGKGNTFNGGGSTNAYGKGGGATDFRLNSNNLDAVVIVSGGGGGATEGANGLAGGASGSGNNGVRGLGSDGSASGGVWSGGNHYGGSGGGGGYYGGTAGYFEQHICSPKDTTPCYTHRQGTRTETTTCSGYVRYVGQGNFDDAGNLRCEEGCSLDNLFPHYQCPLCGAGWHNSGEFPCKTSREVQVSYNYWEHTCGYSNGQVVRNTAAVGGSNYTEDGLYLVEDQSGVQYGNGRAKLTTMYTAFLDTSSPRTANGYDVNSSNQAYLHISDTLLREEALPYTTPSYSSYGTTDNSSTKTWGLLLIERDKTYSEHDKLPVPTLKGWKFLGWYTDKNINKGVKVTDSSGTKITNYNKLIDNHTLYAHWQEEVYYIKYYKNNTVKNVYNDTITKDTAKGVNSINATFNTGYTGAKKSGATEYTYNASEDCYVQTVKYDHPIKVLPNYYSKTGYYFTGWTNQADTTTKGTVTTTGGSGTGKKLSSANYYLESKTLSQHKDGDKFKESDKNNAKYGNFNYIMNEKAMATDSSLAPQWSYGSDTVIFYATWEPIKYTLRFNGTDNWNTNSKFTTGTYTKQDSYLQNVKMANNNNGTTIRYDQVFNLDTNLFARKAPYTIKSPDGLDVQLKSGYQFTGWGFGKNSMELNSYKLISMHTENNPDQALLNKDGVQGIDYTDSQKSVVNVISKEGIKAVDKYIKDWSNARTDSNRSTKTELDTAIESNLHAIWRRNSNDDHINNGTVPDNGTSCPSDSCGCPPSSDPEKPCKCPSDLCPDRDNDGTCDCHDPEPDNPKVPDADKGGDSCPGDDCNCPENPDGTCDCPSDLCDDSDDDGTCDCHDPEPLNPNVPDDHRPDVSCPEGCPCPDDGNGNCTCPSDVCPDRDNDGTCDCHDREPDNPNIPDDGIPDTECPDNCPCPDDGNGNCTCPSDNCPDSDNDDTCDCHDPEPNNPKVPDDGIPDYNCPNGDCNCPDDGKGGCECPSDKCLDDDNDGTCNCHDPEPNNPKVPDNTYPNNPCPDGNCSCPDDGNGNCECPSDDCEDSDKDGICDCHDPEPNHPAGVCPDGCNCPENPDGTCNCPSDQCKDDDKDGICNCHDPEPKHPHGTCPDGCSCPENPDGTCDCPSDKCKDDDKDGICNCHDPEPKHPDGTCPDNCNCPEDEDGNCECPSDECTDTDKDGICDCHDPDPNRPADKCPDGCNCPEDANGNCECPSDECDDRDKDGICDCHDPDISNDKPGSDCPDNCPCPEKPDGDCDCPSSSCPDTDNDGICNCHDPNPVSPDTDIKHDNCPEKGCGCPPGTDPQDPSKNCLCPSDSCKDSDGDKICDCHDPENNGKPPKPGDDNEDGNPLDPDDDNFGITITFDLNGGYIVSDTGALIKDPIVLKQELFNDYYYEFDIIGNDNVDLLHNLAVLDAYGNSSNTSTPENNYDTDTGVNYTFRKSDGMGGKYRLSGWSTEKGAVYPDFKITIDGIKNNNFDAFDFVRNNDTIKICNDTTLYAIWEPVLQLSVNLNRTLGGSVKTGTLTATSNVTNLPKLALNPGEEVKYQIIYKGENTGTVVPYGESGKRIVPIDLEVTFDKLITGIYLPKYNTLHDGFNQITPDDTDSIKEVILQKYSNLDRKLLSRRDGMINRKFNLPLYIGTLRAKQEGYPSFKEGGYTMTVTASRYSSFYKGLETVTAELLLVTDGTITPGGVTPPSGGGGGGNSGGNGNTGENSSIANEIKSSIKLD